MLKPYIDHFTDPTQLLVYKVNSHEAGLTIYQILRQKIKVSRGLLRKVRNEYRVRVNGKYLDFSTTVLNVGDLIEMNFNFDEIPDYTPEPMKLDIIFEDQNLLVINKEPGILVHPTAENRTKTLANGVLAHLRKQNNYNLFRPIHRLDRNTSGLILIAKNHYAHNYLTDQFEHLKIHREYLAFVHGVLTQNSGTINAPIGRAPDSIIQRQIDYAKGKDAITHFVLLEQYIDSSLIKLTLETGRTHQIRVHLSHLGYPLVGDSLYGGSTELITRHALHSHKITCYLPLSHRLVELTAPLTPDLARLHNTLRKI